MSKYIKQATFNNYRRMINWARRENGNVSDYILQLNVNEKIKGMEKNINIFIKIYTKETKKDPDYQLNFLITCTIIQKKYHSFR